MRAVKGEVLAIEVLQAQCWSRHRVVAGRYRYVQAFLVDDAAHLRRPKGGFGANTGIGDAVDLGRMIAAVDASRAPEALLGTSETKRRPIAIRNTNEITNNRALDHMTQPDPVLDGTARQVRPPASPCATASSPCVCASSRRGVSSSVSRR